jgi:transposase-like protein
MINTREIAVEYRLAHWVKIMQERSDSGLSIKAYCESISLHQNVYYYWQRKLREAACQSLVNTQSVELGSSHIVINVSPSAS